MKNIKEYAAPAFVLFLIGLIATLLLGMTNDITAPKIAQLAVDNEKKSRQTVFSDAAEFGEVTTLSDGTTIVPALDASGNKIGSVVVNSVKGYGGAVSVMTGVDNAGKVTGVNILSHSETAGLGANSTKESFRNQFVGLIKGITVSKDAPGKNSIDALTGATITSRAVTQAVNAAIEAAGGESNG